MGSNKSRRTLSAKAALAAGRKAAGFEAGIWAMPGRTFPKAGVPADGLFGESEASLMSGRECPEALRSSTEGRAAMAELGAGRPAGAAGGGAAGGQSALGESIRKAAQGAPVPRKNITARIPAGTAERLHSLSGLLIQETKNPPRRSAVLPRLTASFFCCVRAEKRIETANHVPCKACH